MGNEAPYWGSRSQGPDRERRIAELAARQHGNVTHAQLIALGLGKKTIAYRGRTGRLHRVHPSVYAVGRPPTTPLEHAAAAVLACGPHAVLSHRSAMVLWGLWKRWERPLEVTLSSGDRRTKGIKVHRSRTLSSDDMTVHFAIRVTSPARTLLDCAPLISRRSLTRAVNEARLAGLVTIEQLATVASRRPNHPGAKLLALFAQAAGGPTRSQFEDTFVSFCARHNLPKPTVNTTVSGYEVDALFAEQKVIVELDGWKYHSSRTAFERDRERDAQTLKDGYATVRITWERLNETPAKEAERLRAILGGRGSLAA